MQRVKKPQLKRDQAPKHTMTMTIVENGGSGLKNTTQVAQIHTPHTICSTLALRMSVPRIEAAALQCNKLHH